MRDEKASILEVVVEAEEGRRQYERGSIRTIITPTCIDGAHVIGRAAFEAAGREYDERWMGFFYEDEPEYNIDRLCVIFRVFGPLTSEPTAEITVQCDENPFGEFARKADFTYPEARLLRHEIEKLFSENDERLSASIVKFCLEWHDEREKLS